MSTGERIRELRRKQGWKQSELGERLGISASAIGMYEHDRRQPSMEILLAMSELFGVTTDFLLCKPSVDLEKELDAMREKLFRQEGLMFRGQPIDQEGLEKVFEAACIGAEMVLREEEKRKKATGD